MRVDRVVYRGMLSGRDFLQSAGRYLRGHPEEVARILRSSFGLRFGVPLAAFRWLVEKLVDDVNGLDPEITARPPGLQIGMTFEKMESRIRFTSVIYVARVDVSSSQIRLELRFEDVALTVLNEKRTVLSALINSGALDISRIGSLIGELPRMPPVIVEATDNRIVFDLLKSKQLDNRVVRHLVGLWSSLITVDGVETATDHLDVVFRALPNGRTAAMDSVRQHFLAPGLRRIRTLVGESPSTSSLVQRYN